MKPYTYIYLILSLFALLSCSKGDDSSGEGGTPPPPSPPKELTAIEYAQTMGIGWNLGNSLDAYASGKSNETCWGNAKATQATFNAVKAAGFTTVRIPVTWMGHIGAAPNYTIETAWLNRVAEVVGYAKNAGLKAIINIHHDGAASNTDGAADNIAGVWLKIADAVADKSKADAMKSEISKVWSQIATRFKNEGDWLIFETFNEIHDGFWGYPLKTGYETVLNEWNQTAVDAIRAAGGENATRYIGIPCYAANPSFTSGNFALPTDKAQNKLMVAVHSYDPYDFAGSTVKTEWGHTGKITEEAYREAYITKILDALRSRFVLKGIPVYFGEFGCVHHSTAKAENFRKYYLEYNIKNMREHRMPVMIWDNGASGSGAEKFGLINHATGVFIANSDINDAQEVVKLMVKAWTNNDASYTLTSIYNNAPNN